LLEITRREKEAHKGSGMMPDKVQAKLGAFEHEDAFLGTNSFVLE
jgi:hypothetical protein